MWYIFMTEYYSALKKEWNIAICSNMDGLRGHHTKWIKSEKNNSHMLSLIYGILKKGTNKLIKQKQTHRYRRQIYGYQRRKGKRDKLGAWD